MMNFNGDLTPKYFRRDFSPNSFQAFIPSMRSPAAQQDAEENSKPNVKLPLKDNMDFGSKSKAVIQNYMMPFNNSFIPRTPVDVLKSSSIRDKNKDFSKMVSTYIQDPKPSITKVLQDSFQACPCCRQGIPEGQKLIYKTEPSVASINSQGERKGRKRKNKQQVKLLEEEFT
mmetsp:Transcript_18960/g.21239  ORF Transcript_18960/g.21239 Transcript_18960/m.21239 type:complete len:172 (-) Transcript_18960:294-809(-)